MTVSFPYAAPLLAVLLASTCAASSLHAAPADPIAARIDRVLADTPLIDGHNDWAWALHENYGDGAATLDLRQDLRQAAKPLQTDIPRLRAGHVGGQFWSVWVPAALKDGVAVQATLEQIDRVRTIIARYPDTFEMAGTAADIRRIHHAGRIASLIGVEGGDQIGASLGVLRDYYALGARYMTLTHIESTTWADSASDAPIHHGITDFGRAVIHEMNRIGMMVDCSHVSAETMRGAIAASRAPVIFSHADTRGVNDHGRNIPEDVLRLIATHDGIVMVAFVSPYVSDAYRRWQADHAAEKTRLSGQPYDGLYLDHGDDGAKAMADWEKTHPAPTVTIAQVADHIEHVRAIAGIDHVGLGSDFDGTTALPQGLTGVEGYPALLSELARRGWSDTDLGKVAGGNLLRVMEQAEAVSRAMKDEPIGTAYLDARDPALDAELGTRR